MTRNTASATHASRSVVTGPVGPDPASGIVPPPTVDDPDLDPDRAPDMPPDIVEPQDVPPLPPIDLPPPVPEPRPI